MVIIGDSLIRKYQKNMKMFLKICALMLSVIIVILFFAFIGWMMNGFECTFASVLRSEVLWTLLLIFGWVPVSAFGMAIFDEK